MLRFSYDVAPLAVLIKAAVDENTPNGQLEPGRVVQRKDGRKEYLAYVGVRRLLALKWLFERTHDSRFFTYNAYVDGGLSELQMFVRAKIENEDENGERQGLSVLEQIHGLQKIMDSASPDKLDSGLKRLYELSATMSEERLKKLYDVERRTRSRFTVAQLERLSPIKEDKDFYLASASTAGFGFKGDEVEKAVEERNGALILDWFTDVFPEYSSEGLPTPPPVPNEARSGETVHLEASERELILIACPRCAAKNMLHVEGQIDVTHVPPDPEAESTTDVAESIGRGVPKCWRCKEKFYVFFRHVEGRKYAAEASLSQEFTREPETAVEAVDVRYDYGEKAWQEVIDGRIAGTVDLSGRTGEQKG